MNSLDVEKISKDELFSQLETMLENGNIKELEEEDLVKVCHKLNENKIHYNSDKKPVLFSHCNFKEKYMEQFKMISLRKFLYQMV